MKTLNALSFRVRFVASLGAAALLGVACSAPTAPAPAPSGGGDAGGGAAAKPKVDRVVLAVEHPTRETNEIRHASTPNGWHLTPMYENLVGINPETGKKEPRLATAWAIEPNGKSVRFQLRKGVQFHRGNGEFTANDLLHQPDEARKADSLSGVTPFWRANLEKVEIVNDYEVIYHLNSPNGNFLDYMSDQLGGMEVSSRKEFDKNGPADSMTKTPIAGTGPYEFDAREETRFIRFKRVAGQHWRIQPDFPGFEYRFIREASTRVAALLAGEVHLTALSEDLLQQANKQGFKTLTGRVPALRTFINFYCCALNDAKDYNSGWRDPQSPLNDVRVRRALSKAVNRDELNKGFFAGKGTPLVNNPLGPNRIGWDKSWETRFADQYGYDQAAARRLLTEAGYGPGNAPKVTMILQVTPGLQASQDIAEAVAGYWRQVGVEVALETIDPPTTTAQVRAGTLSRHTWVQATNSNQWVGIYNFGTALGRLPGNLGASGPEMKAIDDPLIAISNTLDEKKIEEEWRKNGEALFVNHKFVPLFWLPVEVAANASVIGDWVLPGSISGSWTHAEHIKAAK